MSVRSSAILVVAAFTAGVAAMVYGLWLWVDRGLRGIRW